MAKCTGCGVAIVGAYELCASCRLPSPTSVVEPVTKVHAGGSDSERSDRASRIDPTGTAHATTLTQRGWGVLIAVSISFSLVNTCADSPHLRDAGNLAMDSLAFAIGTLVMLATGLGCFFFIRDDVVSGDASRADWRRFGLLFAGFVFGLWVVGKAA